MTDTAVCQMIEELQTVDPQYVEVTLPQIKLDDQPDMNILMKKLGLLFIFNVLFCCQTLICSFFFPCVKSTQFSFLPVLFPSDPHRTVIPLRGPQPLWPQLGPHAGPGRHQTQGLPQAD